MLTIINAILCFLNVFYIKNYLHVYQLKNYKNRRYFRYFIKFKHFYIVFTVFFVVLQIFFKLFLLMLVSNIVLYVCNFIFNKKIITSNKTPLIYTNKIKRLYIISILIVMLPIHLSYGFSLSCLLLFCSPTIANFLNFYDALNNKKFIKKAQKKLQTFNTKIIAITGSNGKTSVKNILYEMLSKKYVTKATPSSYNTPLGISKFINENLTKNTQFLILEFGAKQVGDIQKLCKLFKPTYGIVTTISPQHLQTFKTVENIYKTKNELPIFLQKNLCVFNLDNIYTLRMFLKKSGQKIGVTNYYSNNKNIKIENGKTNFILNINGKSYQTSTSLLGEYNILNISLAASLASVLGVSADDILTTILNLKSTPHRLELIKTHINILDDSYNCSLLSAKQSLNVLSYFTGKKMVVTPGIIEGGKFQKQINIKLGELCASTDYVVIVGEYNKTAILQGLKNKNCNKKILFAKTLEDAKQHFKILSNDDTLLLLNDLPDDFN